MCLLSVTMPKCLCSLRENSSTFEKLLNACNANTLQQSIHECKTTSVQFSELNHLWKSVGLSLLFGLYFRSRALKLCSGIGGVHLILYCRLVQLRYFIGVFPSFHFILPLTTIQRQVLYILHHFISVIPLVTSLHIQFNNKKFTQQVRSDVLVWINTYSKMLFSSMLALLEGGNHIPCITATPSGVQCELSTDSYICIYVVI